MERGEEAELRYVRGMRGWSFGCIVRGKIGIGLVSVIEV